MWDGPNPWFDVSGDKLFGSVRLDFSQDSKGNLTALYVTIDTKVRTNQGGFKGIPYAGMPDIEEGSGFRLPIAFLVTYEKHVRVPKFESAGLRLMGYNVVDVAQRLEIKSLGGRLNYRAFTDIFPSATLTINDVKVMHYAQPSYKSIHGLMTRPDPALYQRK